MLPFPDTKLVQLTLIWQIQAYTFIFGLGNKQTHSTLTEFLLEKTEARNIVKDISHLYNLKNRLYLIPSNLDEEKITRIIRGGFEIGRLVRGLKEIEEEKKLDFMLIDTKPGLDEKTVIFLKNCLLTPKTGSVKNDLVRSPGFEPGITGLEGLHQMSVSYQARLQPHIQQTAN